MSRRLKPVVKPFIPSSYAGIEDQSLMTAQDRAELAAIEQYNQELAIENSYADIQEYDDYLPPAAPPSPPRMRDKSDLSPAAEPFMPSQGTLGEDDFSLITHQDYEELRTMDEVNEQLAEFEAMEDLEAWQRIKSEVAERGRNLFFAAVEL